MRTYRFASALAAALTLAPGLPARATETGSSSALPRFARELAGAIPGATFDDKGITLKSADDAVKLRIGGRLHLDPAFGGSRPRLEDGFGSNVDVRRAWIETYLTIENTIEVAFQYDLATRRMPVNDAAIGYHGVEGLIVTLGNFKEPFSLQQLVGNNNTTFVERALPDALVPARNTGFAVAGYGERWTVTGGIFGGNINTGIEIGGIAGTARATYAPLLTDTEVLHLGVAGSVRAYDRNDRTLSFDVPPEAYVFTTSLIDTGDIRNAARLGRIGLEAAYQNGPFRLQGEYIRAEVMRDGPRPAVSFDGGYVEGAWVINGRGRRYQLETDYGADLAVFKGVQVGEDQRMSRGGIGVFELAARYSVLNLKDGPIAGGVERNWTFGVNWSPDKNIRLMANYIRAEADGSPAVARREIEADIAEFRLQLYW